MTSISSVFLAVMFAALSWHAPGPLDAARSLGEGPYSTFRYKLEGTKANRETDCTQFVVAVLQRVLGADRVSATGRVASRTRVQIDEVYALAKSGDRSGARRLLDELVAERRDPRTAGVQFALVSAGLGREVGSIADARPGDLVQYWSKGRDGHWHGHAAVISAVVGTRVRLYGAHESLGMRRGACVGELPEMIDLGPRSGRIVYIVRVK